MKTNLSLIFTSVLLACALTGCGASGSSAAASASSEAAVSSAAASAVASEAVGSEAAASEAAPTEAALEDGEYTAEFETDSTMFHANEACDGKGTLTVKDGEMTFHVSLVSKSIVNLYVGTAEDAQKDGAELLEPTTDTVTYSDGTSEEVYGFDIPVAALDEDFNVAILGKKGKWYDHVVSVCGAEPAEAEALDAANLADGTYICEVTLEGGSGKATVESPATLNVYDGEITAYIEWSSPNYDYMLINGEKYLPINDGGNSVFEIPVAGFDIPLDVVGDTVAMSTPHEVEYTLTFASTTLRSAD